jgi:hypothetical protein
MGHLCYMARLTHEGPCSDKVLYVFYDFETMQDTRFSDTATVHTPNIHCVQQFCTRRESESHIERECEQCGKRKNSIWEDDPVADLLTYLWQSRPWVNKIVAIANNANAFDLHFITNRTTLLKWQPELISNGQKIMCMRMEYLVFLDRVSFLPCPKRKLPEAFAFTASKFRYPHYFNECKHALCWEQARH